MYYNKIILAGNVGKDPEVRTFSNENRVANFSLATTKKYTATNGQVMTQTTWFNVVCNGKTVDVVSKYVKKGTAVLIDGEMTTREYKDQNGVTHTVYEVRVANLQILSSSSQNNQSAGAQNPSGHPMNNVGQDAGDDLPF